MPLTDTTTVQIRLKEVQYSNRIVYEDGPGSLTDVVSDASPPHYTSLGNMPLDVARGMTAADIEGHGLHLEDDSSDGFEEYSYSLEYLDPSKGWQLLKFVR